MNEPWTLYDLAWAMVLMSYCLGALHFLYTLAGKPTNVSSDIREATYEAADLLPAEENSAEYPGEPAYPTVTYTSSIRQMHKLSKHLRGPARFERVHWDVTQGVAHLHVRREWETDASE